jgi:hypothetical protein
MQSERGERGGIGMAIDAKYAAFLVHSVVVEGIGYCYGHSEILIECFGWRDPFRGVDFCYIRPTVSLMESP